MALVTGLVVHIGLVHWSWLLVLSTGPGYWFRSQIRGNNNGNSTVNANMCNNVCNGFWLQIRSDNNGTHTQLQPVWNLVGTSLGPKSPSSPLPLKPPLYNTTELFIGYWPWLLALATGLGYCCNVFCTVTLVISIGSS